MDLWDAFSQSLTPQWCHCGARLVPFWCNELVPYWWLFGVDQKGTNYCGAFLVPLGIAGYVIGARLVPIGARLVHTTLVPKTYQICKWGIWCLIGASGWCPTGASMWWWFGASMWCHIGASLWYRISASLWCQIGASLWCSIGAYLYIMIVNIAILIYTKGWKFVLYIFM